MSASLCAAIAMLLAVQTTQAQLQVTEIMFNPTVEFSTYSVWEWIEVRNTGVADFDFDTMMSSDDGGWMSELGLDEPHADWSPNIHNELNGGHARNTVIPAGGVGILYDGHVNNDDANYDDQLFRDAWGLNESVPLIAVDYWTGLSNIGDHRNVGFWASRADIALDSVDEGGDDRIVRSYDHAIFGFDYGTGDFPSSTNAFSMTWNGSGDNKDGANWIHSASDVNGAKTSVEVTIPGGAAINNSNDLGNPGYIPAGTLAAGLSITEIMYNPASLDDNWEWVEVVNNTGATIDFSATPYVFDDNDNADLTTANITSGSIANGEIAVLYDGDALTFDQVQEAWDFDGANGTNFIAVSEFTALTNAGAEDGDTIAIWASLNDYQTEATTGQDRTTDHAAVAFTYHNDLDGVTWPDWPDDNGSASIHLTNPAADPTVGSNWVLSSESDGLSFNAVEVFSGDDQVIHPGGDVGSPGSFEVSASDSADFDSDGDVDGADFLTWQANHGGSGSPSQGDANGDGTVNEVDFGIWESQYGTSSPTSLAGAVPEPGTLALILLAGFAAATVYARKRFG